jgi:hypothetical protein
MTNEVREDFRILNLAAMQPRKVYGAMKILFQAGVKRRPDRGRVSSGEAVERTVDGGISASTGSALLVWTTTVRLQAKKQRTQRDGVLMVFWSQGRAFALAGAAALALTAAQPVKAQATIDGIAAILAQANNEAEQSQQRVNEIDQATGELVSQYRGLLEQIENAKTYNQQLTQLLAAQEKEKNSLQTQIVRVSNVEREITPLMIQMLDGLDSFVKLDVPFLQAERTRRVESLRTLLDRADATPAEKYRRILEAYQIENDYGRTLETYEGELEQNGTARTVNFLRVGRVAFIYQSLDQTEAALWDQKARAWVPLDDGYRLPIRRAIRIASQQAAPDLVVLPVPAPETAQ